MITSQQAAKLTKAKTKGKLNTCVNSNNHSINSLESRGGLADTNSQLVSKFRSRQTNKTQASRERKNGEEQIQTLVSRHECVQTPIPLKSV